MPIEQFFSAEIPPIINQFWTSKSLAVSNTGPTTSIQALRSYPSISRAKPRFALRGPSFQHDQGSELYLEGSSPLLSLEETSQVPDSHRNTRLNGSFSN